MDRGLSYIKGKSDIPLRAITMGNLIEESAEKFKDTVFVSSKEQNKNLTTGEFLEEIDNFAAGLYEIGLKRCAKILIITNNSIEGFVAIFSCLKGGFVAILIDPNLQSTELEYFLKKLEINCVISVDTYEDCNNMEILEKIVPEIKDSFSNQVESKKFPALKRIIVISKTPYSGTISYETIRCLGRKISKQTLRINQKKVNCHDLCLVVFSSGSTGTQKMIGITHYQIYNGSNLLGSRIILSQTNEKYCTNMLLFEFVGLRFITICLIHGLTVVLLFSYRPEKLLRIISEENCMYTQVSPAMLVDLVTVQRELNLPISPFMVVSSGCPGSSNLYKDLQEVLNVKYLKYGYGMSETMALSWPNLEEFNDFNSVGHIMDHLEAKVVDTKGNLVPVGTTGELYVRGYSIINKYLCKEKEALDKEGWFKTGDIVFFDDDENLHITGRLKNIINTDGLKVSPREVEQILENYPNVVEVCVVGSYDYRLGEEVCACIKLKHNASLTLDEIQSFCQDKLSKFKIPTRLELMKDFPKTTLGKIQTFKLVEEINNCKCKSYTNGLNIK